MDWKSHPHLFANGKFEVKIRWDDDMIEIVPLYVNSEGQAIADFKKNSGGEIRKYPYKFVGLIARPISDMTERELLRIMKWNYNSPTSDAEGFREILRTTAYQGNMRTDNLICLLNIGVYPFNQSHFGDTVIDATTIKQKA